MLKITQFANRKTRQIVFKLHKILKPGSRGRVVDRIQSKLQAATFRQKLSPRTLEPESRMGYRDYYGYSRGSRRADDQVGAYSDWERSSGGCCCGGGYGGGSEASLFSDGTLFALLAGAALAFYILYTTVTMAAAAGRRKKRGLSVRQEEEEEGAHWEDVLWQGRLYWSL